MHELLEYEASVLLDIHQDSSLLVMAEGMGIDTVLYCTLKLHSDPHNLILVSNYRLSEARFLCELLTRDNVLHPPSIITAEVNNKDREAMYKRGGVVFVTSRILVVDLLMERMPASLVSGVLILRTHELQEACQENFAIQLLRERNPSIFIKALSDNAISLTSGYNHAERIMTQAGIPKLILWPRFNIQVVSCFANMQPQVEEVRVKLTEQMAVCQSCILDLIKACIKELVDQNSMLNTDELSLENALLPNFDGLIGLYLDPMWNQLSTTSRRLIGDIASLRRLLRILIEGDAVSFLNTLEGHRRAALSSIGVTSTHSGSSSGTAAALGSRACPSWFIMDQSDRLLTAARGRVYSNFTDKTLKVELHPKWNAITDILREICNEEQKDPNRQQGVVLILVGHENSARTLERYLRRGTHSVRRFLAHSRDSEVEASIKSCPSKTSRLVPQELTLTQMCKLQQPTSLPIADDRSPPSQDDSSSSEDEVPLEKAVPKETDDTSSINLPIGCRKVRVTSRLLSNKCTNENKHNLEVIVRVAPSMSGEEGSSTGLPNVTGAEDQRADFLQIFGHRLAYVLDSLQPRYVILYEPRVAWVRELEVHKARRHVAAAADDTSSILQPLDIFFMVYENSVEEQRYLTHLRREKEAFESLIHLSSRIVIPKDAVLPRSCTDADSETRQPARVIVDMREFRSELPALLHRKGLKVEPMTLSIADYILAPHLCVERKSVSDLIGSLNSGRLYQQCTAMSRHYPNPVLLIEFSLPTKVTGNTLLRGGIGYRGDGAIGFSLYSGRHSISSGGELNSRHLLSKLTLLTIHFPNLRLIWSVTPYCTAELFTELKQGRAEPSVNRLPQDGEHLEDHNVEAVDMLLKLPGVSWKNYRRIMNNISSLYELAHCDLERLVEILDSRECATKLYNFLHADCEALRETIANKTNTDVEKVSGVGNKRSQSSVPRGLALAGRVKTRRGGGSRAAAHRTN